MRIFQPAGGRTEQVAGRRRSAADVDHAARWRNEIRFADVVARFLALDYRADRGPELRIRCALGHAASQVVVKERKQTGTDLAVRGHTDAAALSAEGVRHGRDNADLPDAVVEH